MMSETPDDNDIPLGLFDLLELVREERLIGEWQRVLALMKGDDLILAMEAEQVLKELLTDLPKKIQERIEEELLSFSAKIAQAMSNSSL
ncbi:MAG: hypothetical protein ACFFD4_20085 [Candidatus Odinarchaeota archaeon]